MKAREGGESSGWLGLPRWSALFLFVGLIVGAGFLLWLAVQAFNRSSTLDAGRVRSLNIAADYIAKWPDVATTIAQTSLYHRDRTKQAKDAGGGNIFVAYLYHPEFGEFQITYDRSQPKCTPGVSIYKNRMTVSGEALAAVGDAPEPDKTYIEDARAASWIPLGGSKNPVCFTIPDLDLGKVAPPLGNFSHLLLIQDPRVPRNTADRQGTPPGNPQADRPKANESRASPAQQATWRNGRVVAWVGQSELPIRRLSDLPALQTEVTKVVVAAAEATLSATTNQQTVQPKSNDKTDALEPFDSRVAGKSYRFYWRPISLDLPGQASAGQEPLSFYLVGVAPSAAPKAGQHRTEVMGFALLLFMLIALIPVVKLALLGPVDSMRAIEIAAICVGIVAATALGTTFWVGVRDVLVARSVASSQVSAAATTLVKNIETNLSSVLYSPQLDQLSQEFGRSGTSPLVNGYAPTARPPSSPPRVLVENVVLLDENGRQAAGTVINAARDHVGANFDLGDRVYFRRALDEAFSPGSERIVSELRQRRLGSCDIWQDVEDGLVFDEIRSRTDGAPKTIVSAKLKKPAPSLSCGNKPVTANKDERLQPSVFVAAFVMWNMVSPTLDAGIRYAVVDLRNDADGHPVLFHSDSYRAGVELFDESLSGRTRAKFSSNIGDDPVPCALKKGPDVPASGPVSGFSGIYEEQATLFAVARVPCTDWAVVAFEPRRLVDSQALRPSADGIVEWASLTIFPFFAWMIAALVLGDRAWIWLWPDPRKRKTEVYRIVTFGLAGAAILAILLVEWVSPIVGLALSTLSVLVALGWLAWVHHSLREQRSNDPLDHVTERWFRAFAVMLLVAMSAVPVTALAADARDYFAQVSAAESHVAQMESDDSRQRSWNAIARMEGVTTTSSGSEPKPEKPCATCPLYFTEWLRRGVGYEDRLLPHKPDHVEWTLGLPRIGYINGFALLSLAIIIAFILGLAIRVSMKGLFGFGVALEAVEYPQLPVKREDGEWVLDKKKLPPRFLVIRAGEIQLEALRGAVEMDLYEDIRNSAELKLPQDNPANPKLLLITNLGLLLGDPDGRRKALERLEHILDGQSDPPGYRVAILTSLTPLERLLQSFERERDENDHLGEEQKTVARLERAKYREDMRWSAVFERFTTYYHAARPREAPDELAEKSAAVKLIWKELEYVPDSAVSAMIWDPKPPVLEKEILKWAETITEHSDPEPQAIIDYLASNLIEHYHLMWSLSSRAERLLLYRIAHSQVPNIAKAYALRSLVKRGLVVLDPYPRTMNQSFAQFVQHVERPETIKRWRKTQEAGVWMAARVLFGLALPLALVVLILAAIRNGDSIAAIVPLFIAAGPALVHALSSVKRTAAA